MRDEFHPYKTFQRYAALLTLLLWHTFWTSHAHASDGMCPTDDEMSQDIQKRSTTLKTTAEEFHRLMEGTHVGIDLSALFVTKLDDEASIRSRIQELSKDVAISEDDALRRSRFFPCLEGKKDLQDALIQLIRLEHSVSAQRLAFLSLPPEHRMALLDSQSLANQHVEEAEALNRKQSASAKRAVAAEQAARDAEAQAQQAATSNLRALATEKAIIEKYRQTIAELAMDMTSKLTEINQSAKRSTAALTRDATLLSREKPTPEELYVAYANVSTHWRALIDELIQPSRQRFDDIPPLPTLSAPVLAELQGTKELDDYLAARTAADKERLEAMSLRERLLKESSGVRYRLLLLAGRVRAQLISEIRKIDGTEVFALNNDYVMDVFREIRLIPFRPFLVIETTFIESRELLTSGISGILKLIKRFLLLVAFLITPFITFLLLRKLSRRIDEFRDWLVKSRNRFPNALTWALWIKRFNPYVTWVMLIIATRFAAILVSGTDLEAVAGILPYFEFFFLYRIFLIMLEDFVVLLTSYLPREVINATVTLRINKTATLIGRFFLVAAYTLHATQSVARTGLVYYLVWDALVIATPLMLAVASFWWRKEIALFSASMLPEALSSRIERASQTHVSAFLVSLPVAAVLILMIISHHLYGAASEFDVTKRLSARIFRKKLETAAKSSAGKGDQQYSLDKKYKSYFELGVPSQEELLISSESESRVAVLHSISDWLEGRKEEHTIAIQGEKGIGKSTFLKQIEAHFSTHSVKRFSIQGKITSRAALLKVIGDGLGIDLSNGDSDLLAADQNLPKTIVLIDEGQNLFLARRHGFDAFKTFTSLLNSGTKNILWCVALNKYSWAYLNAVTGGSAFFRVVRTIESWSDEDIKAMILKRHEMSGFRLEYDPMIFATESSSGSDGARYVQDRFFQLLWEQSRGNARTALILWLSALRSMGAQKLRVGLPVSPPSKPLAGLTDDELFVIASVIRHENLTNFEAQETTSLSDAVVIHALRVGVERGFLARGHDHRYRVQPLWQHPLTAQLIGKNFVYE